jgi:hypothetical protein
VLVLGYSALDTTVLDLFKESADRIRSLYVVNAGRDTAMDVAERMSQHFGFNLSSPTVGYSELPFEEWVRLELPDYSAW